MTPSKNHIWIASFDIGKKNFAFCIEEIDKKVLLKCKLPKNRYNENGTMTNEMKKAMEKVLMNGKTILFKNSDLTENCDKKKTLDTETYYNMYDLLNKYVSYFDYCECIVIERQMMFGKQTNPMAVKLAQHCYSFFVYYYGRFKPVFEYDAYNKTQVLGCEMTPVKTKKGKTKYKAIDKPARKKWSVKVCEELLKSRNDTTTLDLFYKLGRKKDDISDTILQLQAFKVHYYIDNKIIF